MTPDERLDHTPTRGGKHPGKTWNEVAELDPSYVTWAYETWSTPPCSELLYRECLKDVAESRRQARVSRDQSGE